MKILFVITGLGIGGAEQAVVGLADNLAERGHEIKIAFLTGPALSKPTHASIEIIGFDMRSKNRAINVFFLLRKLILQFNPDVVHSHMVHANLLTRITRIFVKIPRLVCTAHSTNEGGKLRMLAYRATNWLSDVFTNVSQEAVITFEKKGAVVPGKMIAITNGIDVKKFDINPVARSRIRNEMNISTEKIVLAVARLHEAKDYPNLLRAFAKIARHQIYTYLWIVGDGPLRRDLELLSNELGLTKRVRFFGSRHDVADLMNAADVFVLSSAWEGFGLVVGEAMATRRVVVATDCGGVRELLGDCGYLVKPNNSAELTDALTAALTIHKDEADALGLKARLRIVEKFSLSENTNKWLRIYTDR